MNSYAPAPFVNGLFTAAASYVSEIDWDHIHWQSLARSGDYFNYLIAKLEQLNIENDTSTSDQIIEELVVQLSYLQSNYTIIENDVSAKR